MKRILGVAAVLVVLGAVMAGPVAAIALPPCPPLDPCNGTCPILAQFDANCYAYETMYTPATFMSTAGSQMTIVGLITQFGGPLSFLNANDPTKEYTFILSALVSAGTVVGANGPTQLFDTDYNQGNATFAIYEGSPRNAPSTPAAWAANPFGGVVVPANFTDGTLILSGMICGFHTSIAKTGTIVSGSFRTNYQASGGTLLGTVGTGVGLLGGNWCATSGCQPANYTAQPNGKFDASGGVTAVPRTTWGRVKQIYR